MTDLKAVVSGLCSLFWQSTTGPFVDKNSLCASSRFRMNEVPHPAIPGRVRRT